MKRAAALIFLFVAGCGADGDPEPVGADANDTPQIGVTGSF